MLPCPVPTSALVQLFMNSSSDWERRTPSGLKITWTQKINCIFNLDQVSWSRTLCSPANTCSDTSAEVLHQFLGQLVHCKPGFMFYPSCNKLGKQTWGEPFSAVSQDCSGGMYFGVFGAFLSSKYCVKKPAFFCCCLINQA